MKDAGSQARWDDRVVTAAARALVRPIDALGLCVYGLPSRIGELVLRADIHLRKRARRDDPPPEIFVGGHRMTNRTFVRILAREVPVFFGPRLSRLKYLVQRRTEDADLWANLPFDYEDMAWYSRVPSQLSFTERDHRRGRRLLDAMGLDPDRPFVCLHNRDPAYMREHDSPDPERRHRYAYRNSRIETKLPAAEHLADEGFSVIRMGHSVEEPLDSDHPGIVDYATHHRSDFGDIYLGGNCAFLLGDATGLNWVPRAFDIPVAVANFIPIGTACVPFRDLVIPKRLYSEKEERLLTFREQVDRGLGRSVTTDDFEEQGIRIVDNTPEEILDLTKEMLARLRGTWKTTGEHRELQDRFRRCFPEGHAVRREGARIGARFLEEHAELLE